MRTAELTLVEAQLADCVPCAAAARFEATLVDSIRERLCLLAAPPGLLDQVRAGLEAELHGG